jgi:flagellar biosynthesis protein FlhB
MAQSRKDLPFLFSSIFSIGLVFISFIYTIIALYQYHERMIRRIKQNQDYDLNTNEKVYWYFYLILGILFLLIEIFICFALLGKIEHWKLNVLKKIKK